MRKSVLLLSLLLVSLNVAAGQLYRWVDAEGKVHYTDEPPPASAKQVQQKNLGAAGGTEEQAALPYAVQVASKKFPVTLYIDDCGEACDQARSHLTKRGVPHATRHPRKNEADRATLQQLTGKMEVPVLVVGGNVSSGYLASSWDALLDAAGYPKSGQLPRTPVAKPAPDANAEKADRKGAR